MATAISQIGKYTIVEILGRGAMGVVYKGYDPMIQRYVAIKTIGASDGPEQSEEIRIRFKREAQAAGNLNHPNIVSIYEYGEEGTLAYIVMEYVEGQTLSARMKQNEPLTVEASTSIIKPILSALGHAHAAGVAHRDIKPANIILSADGGVKVADFGIARVESSELTRTGTIIGTPGYMSPEQLKGETVDARSDLFSVGVILYEMLTGQRAFGGSTIASVIYKIINQELPPPSQIRRTIPAGLDSVVTTAVAKSAVSRFQSAEQFSQAIDTALHHRPHPEGPTAETDAATHSSTPSTGRKGRHKIFALAGLLLLAALAGTFLLPPSHEEEKTVTPQFAIGEVFKDCDTCPTMVVIPAGNFIQGTPAETSPSMPNERPVRMVRLESAFAVGAYEVTRREYAAFIAESGHTTKGCSVYDGAWRYMEENGWQRPGYAQDDDHPAVCVSWDDAHAYTQWLSRTTGHQYRLPSASEWEYVADSPGQNRGAAEPVPEKICNDGNVADLDAADHYPGWSVSACSDRHVHTAPAGEYAPNAFGVFDMMGNAFEWVADCWNDSYAGAPVDGSAWTSGDCARRVLRGGSWYSQPRFVRAAYRNSFKTHYRSSSFGFRVARDLELHPE